MGHSPDFEIVVYGASGFTGRLVCEYLATHYAGAQNPTWAMAGRDLAKLAAVRAEIGAPATIPLLQADAGDPASLDALARRAKVAVTTVGPYQLYGSQLVAACARAGTDYVDLCGEPAWMRQMIDAHHASAQASGARIVFSCGFDSIPFDMGVLHLQTEARKRFGHAMPRVKGRVRKMRGTFSGGTAASLKATLAAAARDPDVLALLKNPFSLTPGFEGPKQPSGARPEFDAENDMWLAPFVMAAINTRNVHRSNFLMRHAYGPDFVYDEMMIAGTGAKGEATARAMAAAGAGIESADGPKPGEGPSREEREAGFYDLLFIGEDAQGQRIRTSVRGDRDPGYGSTSKMIAESAMALLNEAAGAAGGVWTAAAAFGTPFIARLQAHAGLAFAIEDQAVN